MVKDNKVLIKHFEFLRLRKERKASKLTSRLLATLELWHVDSVKLNEKLLRAVRHRIEKTRIKKLYYREFGLCVAGVLEISKKAWVFNLVHIKVAELLILAMRERFLRNKLKRVIQNKKNEISGSRWQQTTFGLYNACVATHFFRKWFLEVTLRLKAYNAFFEIRERFADRTTFVGFKSASHYKIKLRKKGYRSSLNKLIKIFFKDLRVLVFVKVFQHKVIKSFKNMVVANIIAPRKVRRRLVTSFGKIFKKKSYMVVINLKEKAIFNGCRARKSRRLKKRKKGFRYYL